MPLFYKVADFTQVEVMKGLGKSEAKTAGACHNFTLAWLAMVYEDKGDLTKAATRMANLSRKSGGANAVLQMVFGQQWTREGVDRADRLMLHLRGLKNAEGGYGYSAYDLWRLVGKLKAPAESGMLYSFWFAGGVVGAEGGAHTVGFWRPVVYRTGKPQNVDTTIIGFDPNFGEFHIPEEHAAGWASQWFLDYGGAIQSDWLRMVVPV